MKTSATLVPNADAITSFLKEVGQRIYEKRRKAGMSQEDLAKKAGVSSRTMFGIEQGAPTVQMGFWLSALWSLDMHKEVQKLVELLGGSSQNLGESMRKRVRGRIPKAA